MMFSDQQKETIHPKRYTNFFFFASQWIYFQITNMSSLLKRAEEYSSVVESTNDRLANERLERMIPADVEEVRVASKSKNFVFGFR